MTNIWNTIYQVKISLNSALLFKAVKTTIDNRCSVAGAFERGSEINYCVFFHVLLL